VGINALQDAVQALGAVSVAQFNQTFAKLGVSLRSFKQRLYQRAQVKACSSDEYRGVVASFNFLNSFCGDACVITRGEVPGWLDNIDKVMGHTASLCERDFCCSDGYSTIDLHGIEIDDLTVTRKGQLDSQLAFTRSGGPYDCGDQSSCAWSAGHRTMLATVGLRLNLIPASLEIYCAQAR